MTIPYEFASKFPLTIIVFIFSAGLLFTAFFPFDIMGFDDVNGWSVPSLNNLSNLGSSLEDSYRPTILLHYLSDLPNGLIKIILFSIVPGVFLFLMQDVFMWINHKIMRGKFRSYLKKKDKYDNYSVKDVNESIKFTKWLKENGYFNYADTLSALKYVPTSCLFAFESLTILTGFLFIGVLFLKSVSLEFLTWFLVFALFGIATYLLTIVSDSFVNTKFSTLYKSYKRKYQTMLNK